MTTQQNQQVSLHIMEREFLLSCKPEEQLKLKAAADMLEQKITSLRNAGHTTGMERIAILAGLQLAVELIDLQAAKPLIEPTALREKIRHIENNISQVL
ncbi:MAG: cell division protein ZapA [Pseudomonadota bacterium]